MPDDADIGVAVAVHTSSPPALVYVKLFDNCNLRCNMCDCWKTTPQHLSHDHAMRVVRSVLTARPRAVRFTGGEPLLHPRLGELVRVVADRGSRPVVITNGRILDRRINGLVDAGLAELVVSIDGPEAVHDDIRGRQSLPGIRGGLQRLPRHIMLGINTVVQEANLGHLDATLELLLDLPVRPAWWHLIPVRDRPRPEADRAADAIAQVAAGARAEGVEVIADLAMFEEGGAPCAVPQYVTFVDALTGAAFGCNMLVYADQPIGNALDRSLAQVLSGAPLAELRARCASGAHEPCRRCDPSSRAMNDDFRIRFT